MRGWTAAPRRCARGEEDSEGGMRGDDWDKSRALHTVASYADIGAARREYSVRRLKIGACLQPLQNPRTKASKNELGRYSDLAACAPDLCPADRAVRSHRRRCTERFDHHLVSVDLRRHSFRVSNCKHQERRPSAGSGRQKSTQTPTRIPIMITANKNLVPASAPPLSDAYVILALRRSPQPHRREQRYNENH